MKILIADDHAIVRIALRQILSAEFRGAEFGEARSAAEALSLVAQQEWSVLVLDIAMPGKSGLDVLGDLRYARPTLPILVYSGQSEEQFALRVLRAGAAGFLTKESEPEELVRAVRQVLAGRKYVTPSVAQRLVSVLETDPDRPRHENLSNREFHVLRAIATGKSAKEIASDLTLSIKTVSTYRMRLLQKLDLHTNADLIRYAVDHKLVE